MWSKTNFDGSFYPVSGMGAAGLDARDCEGRMLLKAVIIDISFAFGSGGLHGLTISKIVKLPNMSRSFESNAQKLFIVKFLHSSSTLQVYYLEEKLSFGRSIVWKIFLFLFLSFLFFFLTCGVT